MPRHEYRLVDVFTKTRFTGNPLAVFPNAEGIDATTMQRIAGELNLSETTFVSPSSLDGCHARVRIFTPRVELPMAGHPTLGTAWVLDRGDRIVFEEGIGAVEVHRKLLEAGEYGWWMRQPAPIFLPALDTQAEVADALGVGVDDLDLATPSEIGSSGVPFLYVPIANLEALRSASLSMDRWSRLKSSQHAKAVYLLFSGFEGRPRSRMFAPALGIAEDPATGGAGGPLIGYLIRHGLVSPDNDDTVSAKCEQGVEMGRPSLIYLRAYGPPEKLEVEVGGSCVGIGGGWIDV